MKFCSMMGFMIICFSWNNLWFTDDQLAFGRYQNQQYAEAAELFHDPIWKGTAWFRTGEFEKADKAFAEVETPQAEYNRGNCLIMLGQYDDAIQRFDRALELKPNWEEAKNNRKIAVLRRDRTKREGGDLGDQKLGADEIRFDKNKKSGGQDTKVESNRLSSQEMQALWLRRVQTKPADFLKSKFAYQQSLGESKP